MADARFAACLPFILKAEGGNDDDPQDHGGRTSRGVIQREYDKYRDEQDEPRRDVWTASDAEIADIYEHKYWLPLCPSLPIGVDLLYFNMSVNAGPGRAAKLLQSALGVTPDGWIGPITLGALRVVRSSRLIQEYSDRCEAFYRALAQFPRYGRGWLSRTNTMEQAALNMTSGSPTLA